MGHMITIGTDNYWHNFQSKYADKSNNDIFRHYITKAYYNQPSLDFTPEFILNKSFKYYYY